MAEYGAHINQTTEQAAKSKVRVAASVGKGCMLTVEEAEALEMETDSSKRIITPAVAAFLASSWQ